MEICLALEVAIETVAMEQAIKNVTMEQKQHYLLLLLRPPRRGAYLVVPAYI